MAQEYARRCPECGVRFTFPLNKGGSPKRYCTPEHKRTWENRQLSRGMGLVILAQAWRQGRNRRGSKAAKWAFTDLCLALDRMSAEDREAGRLPALDVLTERLRAEGLLGIK